MNTVFITSTLHNDWNLDFNPKICQAIEDQGISCHLPQRDTNQAGGKQEKFDQNFQGVKNANTLLAIGKNESVNWGVEVGFAIALGKKVVILSEEDHEVPLMAAHGAKVFTVKNIEEIDTYIKDLVKIL